MRGVRSVGSPSPGGTRLVRPRGCCRCSGFCRCWATNPHPWWPLTALRVPRCLCLLRAGRWKAVEICRVHLKKKKTIYFYYYYYYIFLLLALVSLADVAAGGGRGSGVIAWHLGASLSSPFSSSAAVAKDFFNYRLKYNFDGK